MVGMEHRARQVHLQLNYKPNPGIHPYQLSPRGPLGKWVTISELSSFDYKMIYQHTPH